MAEAVAAFGINPVDDDDHQSDGGWRHCLAGCDGVFATLHGCDDADDVVEGGMRRGEFEEDVSVSDGVDFSAALKFLGSLRSSEDAELFFFTFVVGKFRKSLVEAFRWTAKDVDVLDEGLVDCSILEDGRVVMVGHLNYLLGVEAVGFDKVTDFSCVVLSVDSKSFTNIVLEA